MKAGSDVNETHKDGWTALDGADALAQSGATLAFSQRPPMTAAPP